MPLDVEAKVIRNTRLSSDYNVIALAAPEIAAAVAPGQFVMVKPGRGNDPLLRRPFSVFEILRANGRVEGLTLLSKRVGSTPWKAMSSRVLGLWANRTNPSIHPRRRGWWRAAWASLRSPR